MGVQEADEMKSRRVGKISALHKSSVLGDAHSVFTFQFGSTWVGRLFNGISLLQ
jgi:hypothetical protein